MSDGKRYGLSDSLLDAVRSVQAQDKNLETNEEKHRGALGVNQQKQTEEPIEEMSSKEKMKKGLYNGKMDPVGKADKDIDNDGDVDDSDEYLHKRRKAIKKSMAKEAAGSRSQDKTAGETSAVKQGASDIHKCAKQVAHEEWGKGETIAEMHGDWDEDGNVPWYDVLFAHGIETVMTEDLEIISEMHHGHKKKKTMGEAYIGPEKGHVDNNKDKTYSDNYDRPMKSWGNHFDKVKAHAKKHGLKVNHDDNDHKHKKPDITMHTAMGDDDPHAYTVHHNGQAMDHKELHHGRYKADT